MIDNSIKTNYILEFNDAKNNINLGKVHLFSLIKNTFLSLNSNIIKISINKNEYNFVVEEETSPNGFTIHYNNKSFFLFEPFIINFRIQNINEKHFIYTLDQCISLINNYGFKSPYIYYKGKKLIIKMEEFDRKILSKIIEINDKTIYEEKDLINFNEYILNEKEYSNVDFLKFTCKKNKLKLDISLSKYFGKYTNRYVSEIDESKSLVGAQGSLMFKYMSYLNTFNFVTGPDKTGKTFSLLYGMRLSDYFIYFNLEVIYKLENEKKM